MRTVALGEVAQIVSGATPKTSVGEYWGGDVPWATPADLSKLDGAYIGSTPRNLTLAGVRSCATSVLPAGSVLLSSRAPIGHVAINTVPMATNQGFKSLVPVDDLDAKFLYHWLRANRAHLESLGNGATFKELSKRTTEQVRIPLPAIAEQRRIAAILDHADSLRAKRRQVLAHLDALPQAIFRQMFAGEPGALATLGDVVPTIENGKSPTCETRPAAPDEWGVLKLGAVTYGRFEANENKAYLGDVSSMTGNEVQRGDVLMTRKNTRDLVGAVAVVPDVRARLLLPDLIFRLKLDPARLDTLYFHAMMSTPTTRASVRNLSSGSAASMPNISKTRLRALEIPVPPMSAQQAFAERVRSIATRREIAVQALASADELFASLQSRAFRGEL